MIDANRWIFAFRLALMPTAVAAATQTLFRRWQYRALSSAAGSVKCRVPSSLRILSNMSVFRRGLPLLLALCTGILSFGQAGRGSVSGLVTDQSGAIIPGASVTLLNHASGIDVHSVADAGGLYNFISLNPGVYKIIVSHSGFQSVAQDNVNVSVDQATTVNIALRVGATTDTVTVSADQSLMETSNSTVGQLISAETIDRVPMLTRNVFELIQLSDGVTPVNGSPNQSQGGVVQNISNGYPNLDVSSYTVNGSVQGSIYYMFDGSPLGVSNGAAIVPSLHVAEDAISEFRVETQNTPASYQSGGAGVISLASKSGGNQFHGDAFVVIRPEVLSANEYFNKQDELLAGGANTAPPYHRYQEGGAIGGPILHKKLFFFGDYEATQQNLFDGSSIYTVPTPAEAMGDFTADPEIKIFDPIATNPDGSRNQFFGTNDGPGCQTAHLNCIPKSYLNPIAQIFLAHLPAPNHPAQGAQNDNNFQAPGVDPTTAHKFDIRMDYNRGEKQHIFGRFSFERLFLAGVNAFNNAWDGNFAQNITNGRNILLADDYTVNASTALQFRYSFARTFINQGGDPAQSAEDDLGKLGFVSPTTADEVYKTLPYVTFNDSGTIVGGTAQENTLRGANQNQDASVTLTKALGKHELSAGFEFMKRFFNVGQPAAPSGAYYFDQSATTDNTSNPGSFPDGSPYGNDIASFLIGMGTAPNTESLNFTKDLFSAEAAPYYASFIEDTYRPRANLTLTAGLRWDIFGGKTERHNRIEYFDPHVSYSANGVPLTGGEVYATNGNRNPYTINMKDFGPRVAFSWQPIQHWVVRGGAGIYFGPSAESVSNPLFSDGFSSTTNWNATCLNADGNSTFNGTSACVNALPGSPSPSTTGIYSLTNPFPQGVVPTFTSAPTGYANNLGQFLHTTLHTNRTQETYNFNFGFEYEAPRGFVLSAGYVGSRGLFNVIGAIDINELDLATIQKYGASLCVDPTNPSCVMVPNIWEPILPPTNANFNKPTVPLWVSLQQFPQFGDGNYNPGTGYNAGIQAHGYPGGDSEYSSLQSRVQKRLTSHFTMLASFTWAKLITDNDSPTLGFIGSHASRAQDSKNLKFEHGVSAQDVKYQFTAQASYDLPIGKGRRLNLAGPANAVFGGWTANGIFYRSTGVPIGSPNVGANVSYFNQRADLVCDPSKGAPHTAAAWINGNCFAQPGSPFIPGTAPAYLDHVRTMGADNVDVSFYKNIQMSEQRDLRFEVSSYNVANKAQLGYPNIPTLQDGTAFGVINSTVNNPRQFQFGSRFTF